MAANGAVVDTKTLKVYTHVSPPHSADGSLPSALAENIKMWYRSGGLGVYAVAVRFATAPLEKAAMIMNSSQVRYWHSKNTDISEVMK